MKTLHYVMATCLFFGMAQAQVGIGTVTPNATLDIKATNQATPANTDGILIPKIDEFPATAPTAAQDGMMVYVTGAGTPTKGFYYWDQATTSWVLFANSGKWQDNGPDLSPIGGTTKDVSIGGSNYAISRLTVRSDKKVVGLFLTTANLPVMRGLNTYLINGQNNASTVGLYNSVETNGTGGEAIGTWNNFNNASTATKIGTYTYIPSNANGINYGIIAEVLSANSFAGFFRGRLAIGTNSYQSGSPNYYTLPPSRGTNGQVIQTDGSGVASWVAPSSLGISEWVDNGPDISPTDGNSKDVSIGGANNTDARLTVRSDKQIGGLFTADTDRAYMIGLNTYLKNAHSNGTTIGFYNSVEVNGTGGYAIGTWNTFNDASTATKIGTYTIIPNTSNGTQYGIISEVPKASSFAGFFTGRVAIGTRSYTSGTPNYYIMPASRGANGQVMQTDGSGIVSWVNPELADADNDTKIQVEAAADEDKIRFDTNGVQRMIIDANGTIGINTNSPGDELHLKGDFRIENISDTDYWYVNVDGADDYNFYYNGTLKAYINDIDGSYNPFSDRKLKKNIKAEEISVVEKVMKLNPVNYQYLSDATNTLQHGFIAQEVQILFPELVNKKKTAKGTFLSLNYQAFGVLAIKTIQEQQKEINELKREISELKKLEERIKQLEMR